MNTILTHAQTMEDFNLDIENIVKSASKVIAPLGPIHSFAARHPWEGLETQSFEQVARRLKDTCDVDIFPNDSILQSALNRGEINKRYLEKGLMHWLDTQALEISRDAAESFCKAALYGMNIPQIQIDEHELSFLAKKFPKMVEKISVQTYSQQIEQQGLENSAKDLNRHIIKWCKLFVDKSQAVWSMPHREEGFYQAWRRLVKHDPALPQSIRKQLNGLPKEASLALKKGLLELEIPYSNIQEYLEAHLLALPGWAGMMLWRSQQSIQEASLLTEYLAVRISMEYVLIQRHLPLQGKVGEKIFLRQLVAKCFSWCNFSIDDWKKLTTSEQKAYLKLALHFDRTRRQIWLEAWEKTYEEQLKKMITKNYPLKKESAEPTLAQFIFCIDVRSEPFRRWLEKAGPFETFGTAGFFGMPIETHEIGCSHSHKSLPIMSNPKIKVRESLSEHDFKSYQERQHAANSLSSTFRKMKHNLLSSLLLPEISGPFLGLQTLARSIVPRNADYSFRKIRKKWVNKPSTMLSLDRVYSMEDGLPIGFSDEEKVHYVQESLKMIGLTENFAPLVVICGHESHSNNNPYAASLHCGACGGSSGGFNARVFAALCNLPKVRHSLKTKGISIPDETVFIAAEHITTIDDLHWLEVPELSDAANKAFNHVQDVLPKVSEEANAERIRQLPNIRPTIKNARAEAERFADDWSEVRPEWGLARNAAFIIGERLLTKECNLEGRVFLHNYDWKKDQNGALLANIIAGPATVSQWINLQYYASTVAPHYYGSGNKATQTVTAGVGVMQGNASDLLSGLPWQSVMQSDEEAYHAPIRLLVIIQAPKEYIERLLEHDQAFYQKLKNGWIRLSSIDPKGNWESWS